MRVLFVSHDATRSGAPIALLQLIRYVRENCLDIEFDIMLLRGGDMEDDFRALGTTLNGWPKYNRINRIRRRLFKDKIDNPYLYLVDKGKYDCIYANSCASFAKACQISKKLQIPIIGHVHEAECLMHEIKVDKRCLKQISHFVTVSELAKRNLVENLSIDEHKISIQYPVSKWIDDFVQNRVKISEIQNFKKKFFLIGMCVNTGWCKAVDTLPIIVNDFFSRHDVTDCKFVVLGIDNEDFKYKFFYELRKLNKNLLDKVVFPGHVSSPLNYYNLFDVYLLSSREESFSLAAQEAAFMKTPIVGYEGATGAAEWIKDKAGILVPYMDFEQLTDAIFYFYSHEDERLKVANEAHNIVMDMYNNIPYSTIVDIIRSVRSV